MQTGGVLNLLPSSVEMVVAPRGKFAVMDRGELVSDDIMLGLIEDRLSRDDARAGFILDGYPRNLVQALVGPIFFVALLTGSWRPARAD